MALPPWRWPAKVGWGLLFVNIVHGFVASLLLTITASSAISGDLKDTPDGQTWEELTADNPWLPKFLDQFLRFLGVAWLGMSIFGFVITWRPFRQEARWAWIVLWVYPIYQLQQASDFLFRDNPQAFGFGFHVGLAILGLAGLAITAPRFFRSGPSDTKPQPSR